MGTAAHWCTLITDDSDLQKIIYMLSFVLGMKNIICFDPYTDVYEALYTETASSLCGLVVRHLFFSNAKVVGSNPIQVICLWIFFKELRKVPSIQCIVFQVITKGFLT